MKFTYSTYSIAQIARIMKLEELKTQGGAITMLDMRSRAAQVIRRERAKKAEKLRVAPFLEAYNRFGVADTCY